MTEKKTFTAEEVAGMLNLERTRTRTIDALLISIQRSRAAGDDMSITDALGNLMNELIGVKPAKAEPKKEEVPPDE